MDSSKNPQDEGCILRSGHYGPHINRLDDPETTQVSYVMWERKVCEPESDSSPCKSVDDCECFTYGDATAAEVTKAIMTQEGSWGNDIGPVFP